MTNKLILLFSLVYMFTTSLSAAEIHDVVNAGDIEKVRALIQENADLINLKDASGKTPLHHAAVKGDLEMSQLLLDSGAEINATNNAGNTPLHFAAYGGALNVVELLVSRGAAVDIHGQNGLTPLLFAAWRGHKEIALHLIEHGADINVKNTDGNTALHLAIDGEHGIIAVKLIGKGAHINTANNFGRTPFHLAATGGDRALIEYFLKQDSLEVNKICTDGSTMLHCAATSGNEKLVQHLLEKGAKIDLKNVYGLSPLHDAAANGHREVVKLLLANGANVNIHSEAKITPLDLAISNEYDNLAELLSASGGKKGKTQIKGKYLGQKKPGMTPVLFAPGFVSTGEANERDVTFSPDLTEFYFTRWTPGGKWDIMVMKQADNHWTTPVDASFCTDHKEAEAFVTLDARRLYFISDRPITKAGKAAAWEIWFTERQDAVWSTPQLLGDLFKGGFYPTVAANGTLYYTARDQDIHRTSLVDGHYTTTINLGDSVNTPAAEYNSCIAADESFLIFTSFGWGNGFGNGDLFICFRKADGTWSRAQNMGATINSAGHDYCPALSPDGKYFFFASNRNGTEDIFWIDSKIIDQIKKSIQK